MVILDRTRMAAVCAVVVVVSACSDMNPSQQRMLTGTTAGAAGGAVLGAIGGNAGLGAAAGAAAGLAGGALYDYHKRSEQNAYEQGRQAGATGR